MSDDPNAEAIRRLSRRVDEGDQAAAERIDALAGRLEKHLDRIEAKAERRAEVADQTMHANFGEMRRDIGELRDVGHILTNRVDKLENDGLAQAARGAAEGAGKAASDTAVGVAEVAAKAASQGFWSTKTAKVVAGASGFVAVVTAIKNVPPFVRWLDWLWSALHGIGK